MSRCRCGRTWVGRSGSGDRILLRSRILRVMNALRTCAGAILFLIAALSAFAQPVDVTFTGEGDLELKGTLLLPEGEGRHPAVLLLPGSGPTDRDGNQHPMMVTDLLKQIAERLAAEGVATLRFDKRAVRTYARHWPREPEQLDAYFAWENFVGDARSAIEFLHTRAEVDSSRIAIAGHSEGGLLALQLGRDLAGKQHAPAGLILLAAAGRTIDVVVREQITASLERASAGESESRALLGHVDAAIEAVKSGAPLSADLPRELQPLFNPTVLRLLYAYFTIDPAELAHAFPGPVLIVQGQEDVQVSSERDALRLERALRDRPKGCTQLVVVAGASHNLKLVTEDEPYGFRGPIAEPAAEAIMEWSRVHLGAKGSSAPPPKSE